MNAELDKEAPLTGIRVIDFGHYIAGPLTGMLLADQGAEVIKINRPGRPDFDTPANAVFNRGKKCLTLDLKTPRGLGRAKALVQSADVLIENFRPGVMKSLGLGAHELTAENPSMVYLSLPGFASTDKRAPVRAFEGIISAAIGQYTDLHSLRRLLNAPPVYTPMPLGSTYGAIHGALAITLALYAREKSGCGEVIEVPLVGAALSAMAIMLMEVAGKPDRYGVPALSKSDQSLLKTAREKGVTDISGKLADMASPFSASYRAGDGRWLYVHCAGHIRNSRLLAKALEIYDDLIADGMVDLPLYENLNLRNNLPDSSHLARKWNRKVRHRIQNIVASEPAQHWVDVLTSVGVPCTIQRTTQEWLHRPETDESALTVVVSDREYGLIRQLGLQTWLSKTPDALAVPRPSEPFTGSVPKAPARQLAAPSNRPILEGIRVLDLSNVLAGPASARTLAEFGAEVIKIDTPEPHFGTRVTSWFPLEVSPGKRSMILNLKNETGKEAFMKLAETADVIVHNFRPGVSESLGIGYEAVKKRKPDIVYVNLTAFGGPRPGPWTNRTGFDPVLQGATGIQVRYAGEGRPPVLHGWASCIDYITGYAASYGAALALLKRRRSGVAEGGDFVTTSLAQGGQLVQAPFMYACDAQLSGDEPSGQDAVGDHALHRFYRAKDGWVFLAGRQNEVLKLRRIAGREEAPDEDGPLQNFIAERVKNSEVKFWVDIFNEIGLAGHRVDSLEDIREEYLHPVREGEMDGWDDGRSISIVRFMDHPAGGSLDLAAPAYVRMKHAPIKLLSACPKQGAHTREILLELGYDDSQVEAMVAEGAAKDHLHEHYLPQ